MLDKLEEKASIDWNNYLTKQEIKNFLNKDDKIESAENIIYDTKGNFFNKYWKDFKKQGWTKNDLVKDLEQFYVNGHLITEGMHLVAYVRSPYKPGVQAIEDSDYASKTDFAKDLRANEFTVLGVNDNRDLYVVDNSDFGNLAQLKKKMKFYKMMWDDAKKENPESTLFKDDYERLKKIYDEAMRQPLNENYVLKGIQDGKSFDISYNDNKEKLQKFMDELQPKHRNIDMFIVEESKKIEVLKPIKKGQMKLLNIGGDGIVYKVSIQDAVRLQNAGYQIFLPQGSRKSIYARAGDIEDYNNGFNVDGEKLQENLKDIVLYHGSSNTNLTYLDIGKSTGNGDQLGRGIYLTTDYEQAQSYAGNNGKVYKVKLDDSLKLFNLNDKLSDSIKQQLIKELENSNNKDIKNYICMLNRKVYDVKDKQEGLKFYQDKQKEWEQLDGKYFGNRPKVVKNGNNLQVIYTDYSDIQSAINNMTGENLIDTLRGDIDPDVFVTIITNSGYDGVITNNNHWYVIYRDINKVHILNENRKFGNKNKLEEVSRNELLVKTKGETITRYNKAAGYKGFSIINIDTSDLLRGNTLTVTCRVGKYNDILQLEDVLYWIQIVAENKQNGQINTKGITEALSNSIDGMDIKIDCNCGDFCLEENTLIKLLNGQVVTVKQLKELFDKQEELWIYSTDEQGDFRPGKVNNVWISGYVNDMIKVTLDNGKEIITTPEHKYMMRDGNYKEAQDLKEKDSLMPLYFSYTNGYENVKRNSIKYPTRFNSVYKIVADTVLQEQKQLAKDRTGEDIIQIHHKDFNKLNNYPSNLYPMGKMEHWMYHAHLGGKNLEALQEGSRRFWTSDPRRFETREKQKQAARNYQLKMWSSFTPKQRQKYIKKLSYNTDKQKLSQSLQNVWNNYTEEEKQQRLQTNNFVVNNPMLNEQFIKSDKFIERNNNISNSLNSYHSKLTKEQEQKIYGWAKNKHFTKEHRKKQSESMKQFHKQHPEFIQQHYEEMVKGAEKGRQNRRNKKLQNMTEEEKELFLFKEQLNNVDISNYTLSQKNVIGHIKPVLIEIYKNKEDFTKETYNKYRTKFNAPKLETLEKILGSWVDICNKYCLSYNHKVKSVEFIHYKEAIPVYDIEVEKYHNFYVDAGVMLHNCYRFAYQATEWGYKYGKPETRPADIRNPDGYGALCKHLTAVLSNKKWLQQVTSTVMDWCVKNIDSINEFLKLTDEDKKLTLPNELARQNAKKAFYTKLFNRDDDNEEGQEDTENNLEDIDNDNSNNNENSNNNNNTIDNQNAVEDETQLQDVDTEDEEN